MTDSTLLPIAARTLPNGAMLYHILNDSKLTRIQAVMRTGSIHEGQDCGCGLSHFLEHMLFQGCDGYINNLASDTIHKMGGDCNAYTTFDHTAYYAEVPLEKFAEAADVICSMIKVPLFPEEKFISEKEVIAREADMIFDRPAYRLVQQLWQGLFPTHPARMPIVGFPDKIAGVTRETMQNYYQRRYGAMRCHFLVTGKLDTDMVQAILSEKLADFTRGILDEPALAEEPESMFESSFTGEFNDPLTRIAMGIRTPHPADRRTPALDLLAGILGGNDSSYLPRKFLYGNELALAIDAEFDITSFGGVLAISAACEPDKADLLTQGVRAELALLRKKCVTAEELAQEKLQQRINLLQQLKVSGSMVNIVNSMQMNFNAPEALDQYLARLDAVTLDEVNSAAEDFLDPRRFVWSRVQPPQQKTSVLKTEELPAKKVFNGKTADAVKYIMLERSNIPLDSLTVLLPAGPVWENDYRHGISQLLAKMLATGSDDLPEDEFYTQLDRQGIELDISCGNNTLSIETAFPEGKRHEAVQVLQKILTAPRRDPAVFERVKNNLTEQLNSKLLETNFAAMLHAKRQLFGKHPGGNSRLESVEELSAITIDDLYNYLASRFDRTLVNLGATVKPYDDADREDCRNIFEELSAQIPWSNTALLIPQPITDAELQAQKREEPLYIHCPREQSTVVCAVAGCLANSQDYYSLLIMDAALNGLASNLFKEVREKRSLAYSTGVVVSCGLVQGITALHAGVKPENAPQTLECLQAEIRRLITEGLSAEEFASAKLAALTSLARQLESVDAQLMHAQLALFYKENPSQSLLCAEELAQVTLTECNTVLKKIFTSSPVTQVVAGNGQYENKEV